MLAPLTILTHIKRKFKWTQVKQYDFDETRCIVAHDTLLTYSGFNETCNIHTNASAFQLRAVISWKGKSIDFYSIELTDSQQRYTVTDRELLSIV